MPDPASAPFINADELPLWAVRDRGLSCVHSTSKSAADQSRIRRRAKSSSTNRDRPPGLLEFVAHLARRHAITGDLLAKFTAAIGLDAKRNCATFGSSLNFLPMNSPMRSLSFYKLPRLEPAPIACGLILAGQFSHRFLREMAVFPCQLEEGGANTLVVADPTDAASVRAAELTLGGPVALAVASFEDIATALAERLGEDTLAGTRTRREQSRPSPTTISTACAILPAAHPSCVPSMICWRKPSSCVQQTFMSSHFAPGWCCRMRVDGLLQVAPTPPDVLPQALISRIKILAGLNIAERRLPQDGAAHLHIARSDVDIRVATMPTRDGESAVIRLLPKDRGVLEITKLGLSNTDQSKVVGCLRFRMASIVHHRTDRKRQDDDACDDADGAQ